MHYAEVFLKCLNSSWCEYKTLIVFKFHSCETALIRVQNNILHEIDGNSGVILLLLDLSATFDMVDHTILLQRMSSKFGIKGDALN